MHFLDKLKDLRIYSNRRLYGLNSELEDKKKGQLVIHIGRNEDDIYDLLKSNLLHRINFRSFYARRRYVSENRKMRKIDKQAVVYRKIQTETGVSLRTKLSLEAYNGHNLIVDATPMYKFNNESIMNKNNVFQAVRSFLYAIKESNVANYKDVLIIINENAINEDNSNADHMNIRRDKNPLSVLKLALRRNLELDFGFTQDQKVTLMVSNFDNNRFVKFDMSKDNWDELRKKRQLLLSRIDMLNTAKPEEVEDDTEVDSTDTMDQPEENTIKDSEEEKEIAKEIVSNKISDVVSSNFTKGSKASKKASNIIKSKTTSMLDTSDASADSIYELSDKIDDLDLDVDDINDNLTDEDIEDIEKEVEIDVIGKTQLNNKKVEAEKKLSVKREKALNKSERFKEASKRSLSKSIDTTDIVHGTYLNTEISKSIKINDFDKSYMEKTFEQDKFNIMDQFKSDDTIPAYITSYNTEDTSDTQTHKETLTVKYEDTNGLKHSVSLDIPKVYDGKFIKVNGSKKVITKQLVMLPIVKAKPTEVWISSNYNKIIMERFGTKNNIMVDYIGRLFDKEELSGLVDSKYNLNFKRGNSELTNKDYPVSSDYMDISKVISSIDLDNNVSYRYRMIFNQRIIRSMVENNYPDRMDTNLYYPVGINVDNASILVSPVNKSDLYELKANGELIDMKVTLPKFLIDKLSDLTHGGIDSIISTSVKANQSVTYSRCNIVNKNVPTVIILGLEIGLKETLEKAGIKYEFTEKNTRYSIIDNKAKIKFKDGYLIYDNSRLSNSLLISGLKTIDTTHYTFEEMNTKTPYIEYFADNFHSRNVSKGISNLLSLMIDPMTKDVLEDLSLPTNIIDILIYANTLLDDLTSKSFNDMSIYRVRGAEQVNAIMYKLIADAFKNYKDSYGNRNPINISLPKDALLKELMKANTVDENSDLNPSLEMDKTTSVTYKGPAGRNSDHTYTNEIRGYDKSMQGVLAIGTPDSNKVGVVRQLSYNSNITGTRGYIDSESNTNSATEIYSPLELMNPFTSRHADGPRIGMASTQSKHIISTATNDLPLISSGAEKSIIYQLSDTFAIKAKENGKVEKIDNKNGLLFVKYDNGTRDVFDIEPKLNKNSNGGFYTSQKLTVMVKPGDKFMKSQILAKNDQFYKSNNMDGNISYVQGKLSKVAIASLGSTYEDSSIITSTMSKDMSTKVTMKKTVNLGKKANIQFLVTEGQKIKTGEPLIIFEPEFQDDDMNSVLDKLGDELNQEIQDLTNKIVKSKYTGVVKKVNVLYNRPLEDCSPSVRKVIEDYKARYDKKAELIKSVSGSSSITLDIPPTEMIKTDKINGENVDGLLLEIFVEYDDELSVGDKIKNMYYNVNTLSYNTLVVLYSNI